MTKIETRYGTLAVPDSDTDVIVRFLDRYGEWAWDEARFVASTLPEKAARVLDIGAFVGTFGLGVGLQKELDFVCFVEANSEIVPLLSENVQSSCQGPCAVVDALVGWPGMPAVEGRFETGNLGSLSFAAEQDALHDEAAAKSPHRVVTLADLRAEHGTFDLLKLDVEGMELEILRSDADFLSGGSTTIWAECNEDYRSLAVAELFLSWGLELFYFAFPAHNPDNLRGDPVPVFPFAYEAGLLAAPRIPPELDDDLRAHRCILRPIREINDLKDALWRTPRWGFKEWIGATGEEIVALACRELRGESYSSYLLPGGPSTGAKQSLLEATQEGLKKCETLAFQYLDELERERERAGAAETRAAQASAEALDRLSALARERERADEAERVLAGMRERAAAQEARADEAERVLAGMGERAAAQEARADEAERALAGMRERAAAQKARADEAERAFAGMRERAAAQEARADDWEARADAMEMSTSWRITAPLRRLVDAFPRLQGALRRGRRMVAVALGRRR